MIFKSPHQAVDIPEIPLSSFVLRHADRLSKKPAFIDGSSGRSLTYGQVKDKIYRLAGALHEKGFGKGDVLAIYASNLPEYPIVIHAVSTAGGAITTANPACSPEELNHQLCETGARYLLTTANLLQRAQQAAQNSSVEEVFTFGEAPGFVSIEKLAESNANPPSVTINPREDLVALPFSSGTTGLPKGVMLTHYNMVANAVQFAALDITREEDVVLSVPPLFHIYGITVVANTIMSSGATVITMPRFDFPLFLKLLQDLRVTQTFVVPPVAQLLASHPLVDEYDLSALKQVICGGAPLSTDQSEACQDRLGVTVLQAYGMTEAGPVTHLGYTQREKNRPGAIGPAYPNTECRIVDPQTGSDLLPGQAGEIWVRGPQVMSGYLHKPEETAQIKNQDGWLRTGDVGYLDHDGYLTVVDRIKELIKVKGFQVAPAELEGLLLKHPQVSEAAVIPSPDSECGEVPVAYVVASGAVTAQQLIDYIAERVTSYKRLRQVEFIDAIPKTSSGKILRRQLIEEHRSKLLVTPLAPQPGAILH